MPRKRSTQSKAMSLAIKIKDSHVQKGKATSKQKALIRAWSIELKKTLGVI